MGIEPPSDMKVMSARKMPIVPSVTMKGSILPIVTISPFNKPAERADRSSATPGAMKIALGPIGRGQAVHEHDHDAGDEGHHRADRQVQPARGDHEGRPDGDDRDEGRAGDDVDKFVAGQEVAG